jgi:outer membrane protein OmpA-like peptidoglycan-associated protein
MKRFFVFVSILLVLFAVSGITACKSPPPPPPPPPPAAPPPPPPPPPPEIEPEPVEDTEGPEISVGFSSEYFSPDGDGVQDELTVTISVKDASPIGGWSIEIREPSSNLLFSEWKGDGEPPATIVWNGRSASGELVQSASDYPFSLTVNDVLGNTSVYNGTIQVDVLVMRESGDILRVIVPSIVFASNSDSLTKGLSPEVVQNNDWILKRIAEVLNKFYTYKVKVEGHANPTTRPGTRARTDEEKGTSREKGLQPLSEERAKAVVEYLVNLGVERERLSSVGMGSSRTLVSFEDKDHWWKNRRVEFVLVK